jgi:hypothetical protein
MSLADSLDRTFISLNNGRDLLAGRKNLTRLSISMIVNSRIQVTNIIIRKEEDLK